MKCKYRFKVNGSLKLAVSRPVPISGLLYEFDILNSLITHICVTIPIGEADLPTIVEKPSLGVKYHLNITSPGIALIQMELRAIEGLLSMYGLKSIDIQNPEIEWLPETDTEKQQLKIFNFKITYREINDSEVPPIPFYLLASSIIAASKAHDIETFLSFYRKGMNDVCERRYIEAIYDFYFFLESLFGAGNFKKDSIKASFKKSTLLVDAIQKTLNNPAIQINREKLLLTEFEKKYKNKSIDEVLEYIVNLRGFLHHHTLRRKDIWHPEDHNRFKLDCLLLQDICFKIAFHLAGEILFDEQVKQTYRAMFPNEKS